MRLTTQKYFIQLLGLVAIWTAYGPSASRSAERLTAADVYRPPSEVLPSYSALKKPGDKAHALRLPATTRPLPMRVERVLVPSCFFVTLVEEVFDGESRDALRNAEKGSSGFAYLQCVDAIETRDLTNFLKHCRKTDAADSKKLFALYCDGWRHMAQPVLTRRFGVGGVDYFVTVDRKAPDHILPLAFIRSRTGSVLSFDVLMDPIIQNITELAKAVESNPQWYPKSDLRETEHHISLTPYGEPALNPVTISFQGCPLDTVVSKGRARISDDERLDVMDATCGDIVGAVLSFYQESFETLQEGDFRKYVSMFGPVSSERLQAAFANPKLRMEYKEAISMVRRVVYAVGSDTVVLLAYQHAASRDPNAAVAYQFVARAPSSGKLAIVNIRDLGPLETLLTSRPFADHMVSVIFGRHGGSETK